MKDKSLKKYIKFLNWIYILPTLILYVTILLTNNYQSEFKNLAVKLNKIQISLFFIIVLIGYRFLAILLEKLLKNNGNFQVKINTKKLDIFFLIVVVLQILFFLKTGNGKLFNTEKKSIFSAIFNLFDLKTMYIYYFFICYRRTKYFYINVFLYLLLELLRGWTGYIFYTFMYAMYFFIKKYKRLNYYIIYSILLLIGAKLYEYLYFFKTLIRFGVGIKILYKEAVIKLVERLTYFPHFLVGIQNSDKILKLYEDQGETLSEIKGFFRPVVPSFLYDKNFNNFNTLIIESVYGKLQYKTSSNMGLFSFLYNLLRSNIVEIITYLILAVIIFLIIFKISQILNNSYKNMIGFPIAYIFLLRFYNNGNLESTFYGYIILFNFIIVLFLLKIIKLRRRK